MTEDLRRIGPYVIEREIGRGGMGIVYLARDSRLGRAVAIKALPDSFAIDPERVARFEREARLLASIQHANIASIHGIESEDGRCYLVLEYVEGETLSERLERGPLPVREALEVCRQVAAALEAAHESGVIHRDLKPGNVRLTGRGEAKVLDFGLAKARDTSDSGMEGDLSKSPTIAVTSTRLGMILGTAAYMSPEQARGRPLDRRTDIWSFGCVLYECLTGRQVFGGETVSDCIAGVLEHEPDWQALPAKTPSRVRELLRRCLDKDAKHRLRDAGDARLELEEALAGWDSGVRGLPDAGATGGRRPASRGLGVPRAVAAVLAGTLLGAAAMWWLRPSPGGAGALVTRTSVRLPAGMQLAIENLSLSGAWDLSPDGASIALLLDTPGTAFGTRPRIYLRSLDRFELQPLPGTELATSRPVFAHDGRALFVQGRLSTSSQDAVVLRIPLDRSAPPVTVTNVQPDWAGFGVLPNGDLLFTTTDGRSFVRVPAGGGPASPARRIDCGDFQGTFSFVRAGRPYDDRSVFLRTIHYSADGWHWGVAVLDPQTGKARVLLQDGGYPVVLASGHLLYTIGEAIQVVRFDARRFEVHGEPIAVMDGVRSRGRYVPGMFELSNTGTLVYLSGGRLAERRSLAIAGLDGRLRPLALDKVVDSGSLQAAENGKRLAFTATNPHGIDEVWIHDFDRSLTRKIVSFPDADCSWTAISPDGRLVAFRLNGLGERNGIFVQRVDDGGDPVRVLASPAVTDTTYGPTSWSPDGREILVRIVVAGEGRLAVLRLDAAGHGAGLRPLLPGMPISNGARFSPDGRWITFTSNRGGRDQVYVCSYDAARGAGEPQVCGTPGSFSSRFTDDGHAIAYRDSTWIATSALRTAPVLVAADPKRLYDLAPAVDRITNFELLPDGRTVVALADPEERRIDHVEVVQNWSRELRAALEKLH